MRFVLTLLVMFAVALGLGFGLSYYSLTDGRVFGTLRSGPWTAWPDVGTSTPNPYTRAQLVRAGTIQLGLGEGLEFSATTDTAGRPLDRLCQYRLVGSTPVASFWTLRATDEARTRIGPGTTDALIRSDRLSRGPGGLIDLSVGPSLAAGTWLETSGEGALVLVLTLYDTVAGTGLGGSAVALPRIERESCA